MTLIINTVSYEGIVMAADSKQMQTNNNIQTQLSENVSKIIQINNRILVGHAGLAFFEDDTGELVSIKEFIKEFSTKIDDSYTVEEVSVRLRDFLLEKYPVQKQLNILEQTFKKDMALKNCQILSFERSDNSIKFRIKDPQQNIQEGFLNVEPIDLIVSGYDPDETTHVYEVKIPGEVEAKRGAGDCGCTWVGHGDVVARLILGYDGRMFNIPSFKQMLNNQGENNVLSQLQTLEYNISWNLLPLQDAIDISVMLIKTTCEIQKFATSILTDTRSAQAVGGPIDVAIITKEHGIQWISKKQPHYPHMA